MASIASLFVNRAKSLLEMLYTCSSDLNAIKRIRDELGRRVALMQKYYEVLKDTPPSVLFK